MRFSTWTHAEASFIGEAGEDVVNSLICVKPRPVIEEMADCCGTGKGNNIQLCYKVQRFGI
jgi:hypothetical protein